MQSAVPEGAVYVVRLQDMKRFLTLFGLILTANIIFAQPIEKAEEFGAKFSSRHILNNNLSINWIGDRYFWYNNETPQGNEFHIVDTRNWKKSLLFDKKDVIAKLNTHLPEDKQITEIKSFSIDFNPENPDELIFAIQGGHYRYNRKTAALTNTEKPKRPKQLYAKPFQKRNFSKDSLYRFCADGDNLLLYNNREKDSTLLSSDGEHWYSFANDGYTEAGAKGLSGAKGLWIGGSHKYFVIREDKRKVGTISIVSSLANPRPTVRTYKYPMPGDKEVVRYEAFIADADSAVLHRLDIDTFRDQQIIVPRFSRFRNTDKSLWFLRTNRKRDTLDLCRVDTSDYKIKTVIREICPPHFNEQLFNYHIINDGKEIIWWSEREGKGAYYLYDGDGKLKNRIAGGDFVAGHTVKIDTAGRSMVFAGYGREKGINPHYKFYYKAGLDAGKAGKAGKAAGSKVTLLTPGNGDHKIQFSPDGKYIFDTWSRMDCAPHYQVCDMRGRVRFDLGEADLTELYRKGWKEPEVVEFMAADSVTKLYGVVYLPFDIEQGKKYPVISNVYPGPQTDLVPQEFILDDNFNQSLAQLGFIVVNVSYRGSCPIRGHKFYNLGYGNLRDYALEDDYAVLQQVGERYPADLDRVGIYGHSGGGFMAVAAMLTRPDFYKVGVAASGNHDNNIYMQAWGEVFHGVTLTEDGFECKIPTNIELAANLKGKLLLITGDEDNNVHPASTLRLAKALIEEDKRFDMMIIPGADHGLGDRYYTNLIRYYFIENL